MTEMARQPRLSWLYALLLLSSTPIHAVFPRCEMKPQLKRPQVCGEAGHLSSTPANDQYAMSPIQVASQAACQELCLKRRGRERHKGDYLNCVSFSYDTASGACSLYSERLLGKDTGMFRPDNSSSTIFWHEGCFHCHDCPQRVGYSPLDNGDFELSNSTVTPWTTGGAPYTIVPGRNSNNAFQCTISAAQSATGCYLAQLFRGCHKQQYSFTFDYKIENATNSTSNEFVIEVGDTVAILNTTTDSWQSGGFFAGIPETARYLPAIDLVPSLDEGAVVTIDNVQLAPVPQTSPSASAPELLKNGDFETGSLAPWKPACNATYFEWSSTPSCANATTITSPGLNGSAYAASGTDFAIRQGLFGLRKGAVYQLAFDYQNLPPGTGGLLVELGDPSHARAPDLAMVPAVARSGAGTLARLFVAPAENVELAVRVPAVANNTQAVLDNFSVKRVS